MAPELGRLNMRTMQVGELVPADYNPRKMDERARTGLSKSIDAFGLVEPVIWNERTGNVVGGHQRLYDLIAKNVQETDVVVVDLPASKEKALNIALNNPAISGQFDGEKLSLLLQELREQEAALADDLLLLELEQRQTEIDAAEMEKFQRDDFTNIVEQGVGFSKDGLNAKNEKWFYCEFYDNDEAWVAMQAALAPHLRTEHEIDPAFFRAMVEHYMASKPGGV